MPKKMDGSTLGSTAPEYVISWGGKSKINNPTVIDTNSPCMCNIDKKYLAIRMLNKWMAAVPPMVHLIVIDST